MGYYEWNEERLGLQIPEMDDEHKKIIALMNALYDLNEAKAPKGEIQKALAALLTFTITHFKNEEAYFKQIPEYANKVTSHISLHKSLTEKLLLYVNEFEKSGTITLDFLNFLKFWLNSHIAGIDKKYSAAVHSKVEE